MVLIATVISIAMAMVACHYSSAKNKPLAAAAEAGKDSLIKRGAYLVTAMVCDDCHSPKRMGPMGPEIIPELRLSGSRQDGKLPVVDTNEIKKGWTLFNEDFTAVVGVWGASFAGNLTSDATGIGNWTEEQFRNAIRKGKYKGLDAARDLLPPMPWPNFSKCTDEDLKAIYTFLKSTKPVKNVVPAPKTLAQLAENKK